MTGLLAVFGTLISIIVFCYTVWAILAYREGRREAGHEVWELPDWVSRIDPVSWMDYWEERGNRE